MDYHPAPGVPGRPANGMSGAKSGLGKAFTAGSNVTFTLGQGEVNEVYYPREDVACIRQMTLVVADNKGAVAEEAGMSHRTKMIKAGIPAYHINSKCRHGRFSIQKEIITDPIRDTLLQRITFKPRDKRKEQYSLFVIVYPHICNDGMANRSWTGDYHGTPMLFAAHDGIALALACSKPWLKMSCGFAGISDGLTDIRQHAGMDWTYNQAETGSIVLAAQIDLAGDEEIVLALGFGSSPVAAGHQARASLLAGFSAAQEHYIKEWSDWHQRLQHIDKGMPGKYVRHSATVLRMSESKRFPGGIIASYSVPWGQAGVKNELTGYHLVWPRDLVETAWGFLALGLEREALRVLNYLMCTRESDGKWCQNMWLEGEPYLKSVQMDQVALPLLLIESCHRTGSLARDQFDRYWPGIKKAIGYLIVNGPFSEQDRWEQQAGLSTFTLAAQIAGLLAGAALAEVNDDHELARYCRETADNWNDQVEEWTYVTGTDTAREAGVEGYYIRVNPWYAPAMDVKDRFMTIKHHAPGQGDIRIGEVVCVDALALVRFGLRAADDPRIVNTIRVIDLLLKKELPEGPCWRRFTKDGYGEDTYGNPFIDKGIGRSWPLLTGERAHYEIAAGHYRQARTLLKAMESFSDHGFFPEQVWDAPAIPDKDLYPGKPTGSAIPLTWAHAEYIKLVSSLKIKRVYDMPRHTVKRYIGDKKRSAFHIWRFDRMCRSLPREKVLRIELLAPAILHWSAEEWITKNQTPAKNTGTGIYMVDIAPGPDSRKVIFTFFWPDANRWEGKNFQVDIE